MENFELFAKPWWVNLFLAIPIIAYFGWKKNLNIENFTLFCSGIFGASFGFVESSVVVYLRGAIGFLEKHKTLLPSRMISFDVYRQSRLLNEIPSYLLTVELYREIATILMIISVSMMAARTFRNRLAVFFWVFAFWDIFYYIGLKISIGWPKFLTDDDVLFLLPVPWFAQVWYPLLVNALLILVVILSRKTSIKIFKN